MTLAKTCLASDMMHDLDKSTYGVIASCNHKSFLNRDVSIFHCCNMTKLNLILKLKLAMLNE